MKTKTIYALIKIEIESDLHITDLIDEFQSDALYNFEDTENCKVINTRWEETTIQINL